MYRLVKWGYDSGKNVYRNTEEKAIKSAVSTAKRLRTNVEVIDLYHGGEVFFVAIGNIHTFEQSKRKEELTHIPNIQIPKIQIPEIQHEPFWQQPFNYK